MKFCPNCGNNLNGNEGFCPQCGSNLNPPHTFINNTDENVGNISNTQKSNKKILILIVAIIGVIILGIMLYLLFFNKENNTHKESSNNEKIQNPMAFVIANSNDLYAIFNENGEQLSEFIYTQVSDEFFEKSTLVTLQNKINKVIDITGKEIIKVPEGYSVEKYGALYYLWDDNAIEYNGDLYNLAGEKVKENVSRPLGIYFRGSTTTVYLEENELVFLNHEGKETIRINSDFKYNLEDMYIELDKYYDSDYLDVIAHTSEGDQAIHFIYNEKTETLLYTLEVPYDFNLEYTNLDYSDIVFEDKGNYIYFKDGTETLKGNVDLEQYNCDLRASNGLLYCENVSYYYFINDDGTINSENLINGLQVIDKNNYGYYLENTDSTYIYYNNELVNTFEGYLINNIDSQSEMYYLTCTEYIKDDLIVNKQGEIVKKTPSYMYDAKNHYHTIYNEGLEMDEIFDHDWNKIELPMIDEKKVSNVYYYSDDYIIGRAVSNTETIYFVYNNKNKQSILKIDDTNIDGAVGSLSKKYTIFYGYTDQENKDYLYNIDLNKELGTFQDPIFREYYFMTYDDDKENYYSYITGKKFYTN